MCDYDRDIVHLCWKDCVDIYNHVYSGFYILDALNYSINDINEAKIGQWS